VAEPTKGRSIKLKGEKPVSEEGINARLSALEFLIEGLWSQAMAALPPEQAKNVLQSLQEASGRWALTPGNEPQDVASIQKDHRLVEAWVRHLIDRIRATEQLVRRHQSSSKNL
jgi:hypothetical protein